MSHPLQQPDPFLRVRVHDITSAPSLVGLCVGYEGGTWRQQRFADHLFEWLPEFALTLSEIESIHSGNIVQLLRESARKVYTSKKFERRGEFGELLLHAAIRQVFGSVPAISKIYYKSANNETVKGFDAVHVVSSGSSLELWLGEAKFYSEISGAISAVVDELQIHTEFDYLRDEFLLISGKIDDDWEHADALKKLLSRNTSLDEVFDALSIPVLLTYNSDCVEQHAECSAAYETAFKEEVEAIRETFAEKALPGNVTIHLILVPLESKSELVATLDEKLKILHAV